MKLQCARELSEGKSTCFLPVCVSLNLYAKVLSVLPISGDMLQYLLHRVFQFYAPAALGVALHHLIFIRGEWTLEAPTVLILHVIAFILMCGGAPSIVGLDTAQGLAFASTIFFFYLTGLTLSICIFRLCFHRLSAFPGPWLARISKLWHVYKSKESQNHLLLEDLREKYGDFVRTG